ncbi:hypothetical protein Taro_018431 [Colocasia esculenta]|uniref:3-deoxy-8-phosphooctulonate synthase n=1 Tax=Colocasia esculenta TaxID=4460 RepID=A0A843URC1_COLES|nr:hypothetical protein [Colocasia esculenta]
MATSYSAGRSPASRTLLLLQPSTKYLADNISKAPRIPPLTSPCRWPTGQPSMARGLIFHPTDRLLLIPLYLRTLVKDRTPSPDVSKQVRMKEGFHPRIPLGSSSSGALVVGPHDAGPPPADIRRPPKQTPPSPGMLFGHDGRAEPQSISLAANLILEKVKIAYDIPIVTDVHETSQCEAVGRVADIIQIPAFLCRQTDLLVAAAKTGKIINIKKGQFCAPSVMVNSAEKVRLAGNQNVMVCERGTMFGYNDLIVDPRNLEWMREANCPVVADITHSLQQPAGKKLEGGGVASGGLRELIPCIARMCVAVGVDGIFMEVHDDPLSAPVDGPTQWPLRHLEELLVELISIAKVSKGKQSFKIDLSPFGDSV